MTKKFEFTFNSRDEYKRKPIAEAILNGAESEAPMFPLMLDGDWGTGKSEFSQKLCNLSNEISNTVSAVYVDSYKSDYQNDPLLLLASAILEVLPSDRKAEVKKKIIPVLKAIGKTGLKGIVSYVLKKDLDIVSEEFEKDLKKSADIFIDSILTEKSKANSYLEALKAALAEATKDKKLLICVDELDRCKPSFAINMIEMVKHVFDVENVYFVLVVNRTQLEASLQSHYGNNVDTKRYLDKFIKFSVTLPAFTSRFQHSQQKTVSIEHFENQIKENKVLTPFFDLRSGRCFFKDIVDELISTCNLSFREVETLVRYLTIYHSISIEGYGFSKDAAILNTLKGIAIFLVAFHYDIASNIVKTRKATHFLEWLDFQEGMSFEDNKHVGLKLIGMTLYLSQFEYHERESLAAKNEEIKKWIEHCERILSSAALHYSDIEPIEIVLNALDTIAFKTLD